MRRLLVIVSAVCVAAMLCAGEAAGHRGTPTTKCKAPKGTRAPTQGLKAGYATSCATAKKVAKAWDDTCEPSGDRLCSVTVAGNRWSCALVGLYRSALYVKCALKETTRGRPAVNFQQIGAMHLCATPQGPFRELSSYYDASCATGTAVAQAWDGACVSAQYQSTCSFDARGERWTCNGSQPDAIGDVFDTCRGARTGGGRPVVRFAAVVPVPRPPPPPPPPPGDS